MKNSKASIVLSIVLLTVFLFSTVTPVFAAPQDTIRIWVSYQSGSKTEVSQALDKANAHIYYDFPELEAYVVSLPEAALNGIRRNPFVVAIEADPMRYPVEPIPNQLIEQFDDIIIEDGQTIPWGVTAVQAPMAWEVDVNDDIFGDATGAGITVCIIDTGYYQDHEDLGDATGGFSQIVGEDWTTDGYGHGTHVAGTINAEDNDIGVVGVSPGKVNLFIVKIFDNTGAWVRRASDLVAAIYTCRDEGNADIISMSLSGTQASKKEQKAFDALYAEGILHVAAASNDHDPELISDPYHYPASYDSVISVSAVDSNLSVADFSQQNDKVELAAPGVAVLSTIPYIDTTSFMVEENLYSAYHIEYSARGEATGDLVDGGLCGVATGGWSSNVVLCKRGDISFYDKVMNVQNSSGTAAIIYNNVEGDLYATLGEGNSSTIIAVSVSQEIGQQLVNNKIGKPAKITSEYESPANGYEAWDGTSMATPHVAAVAALVWSAYLDLSNVQIREALVASALDLGDEGRDVKYGYGLVQALDALEYLGEPPVSDQLFVEITSPTDEQVYSYSETVPIHVSVTYGYDSVIEAKVTLTITDSRRKSTTQTLTTDANGKADFDYIITNRKKGTYTITATATKGGYLTGMDSLTFPVQ